VAFGRSPSAHVFVAVGVDERYRDRRVRAFAVHPGGIATELGRHLTEETITTLSQSLPDDQPMEWKTIPQGAATSVWAATAGELEDRGGLYLEDCAIAEPVEAVVTSGVATYALDRDRADALWTLSESLVAK
jgi:hypothetical protein